MGSRSSIFAFAGGPRAKWVVFLVWFVGIFIAVGPAQLPTKFTEAENNESTSFLPGDAESTKVLQKAEDLQGGELVPAAIVYRRESGLTAADRQKIADDVKKLTEKRFRGVIADGPTAAAGGQGGGGSSLQRGRRRILGGAGGGGAPGRAAAERLPAEPRAARGLRRAHHRAARASRRATGRSSARSARRTARPRSSPPTSRATASPTRSSTRSQFWRDTRLRPGWRAAGQGDRRRGLRSRRHRGLRVDQRHAAAGGGPLVVVLLILIYRSPIFLFIPLGAVIVAEMLTRSVGYGHLRARGDDQRPVELDHVGAGPGRGHRLCAADRCALPRGAAPHRRPLRGDPEGDDLRRARRCFASAATVIAALLCLTIAKVDGTAGLGPIGAHGRGAARRSSMLTFLPALLTLFGRRAFWPFVPHTRETAPSESEDQRLVAAQPRRGRRAPARWGSWWPPAWSSSSSCRCSSSPGCCAGCVSLFGAQIPSLMTPLDKAVFSALRAAPLPQREAGRRDARLLEPRRADRVAARPAPRGRRVDRRAPDHDRGARLLLDRPDHQRQLPHRGRVGRGAGDPQQELPGRRERADRRGGARRGPGGRR